MKADVVVGAFFVGLLVVGVSVACCDGPFNLVSMSPCRLVDTRDPDGPYGGPALQNGVVRAFTATGSRCAIPSTATAVYLNATAISPTAAGHLSFYASDATPPITSALNFPAGSAGIGNGVLVNLSATGQLSVVPGVIGTVQVTLDILGYYTASGPLHFYGVPACRALDTREAAGGGALAAGSLRHVLIQTKCNVETQAKAATLVLTAVSPAAAGHLVIFPFGTPQPATAALNFPGGVPARAAGVLAVLTPSSNPTFDLTIAAAVATDVLIDVTGYYKE